MRHILVMTETFHVYNRGAHKAAVFLDSSDYWRMLRLLYIANNEEPFEMANLKTKDFFSIKRRHRLVDIFAYCLMPNHFHIALKLQDVSHPGNLTRFMRKLCTGYSNYFNKKYDHSGTIWQGPFKKKDVFDQNYGDILVNYIHFNPYFGIKEPNLTKEARADHLGRAMAYSRAYVYSSFQDYLGEERLQSTILSSCQDETHPCG